VKLVQTLIVRDEIDVVEAQLAYHLNAGIDFVIATDHDSQDGTSEVLETFVRDGHALRIHRTGPKDERAWRSHMARLAATEYGADWIVNTDADEFWMPRVGRLAEVLAAVPRGIGVVWGLTRHFVPRPEVELDFAERMIARVSAVTPINDPTSPYRPHAKVAHRADPEIVVNYGAHSVESRLAPLHDWYVADVLHFPNRSLEQYLRKGARQARGGERYLGQYVRALHGQEQGRAHDVFEALVVDDQALERGLAEGSLVLDTRLRDALRRLRRREEGELNGSVSEIEHVVEAAALREADVVRLSRRIDDAFGRVAALEGRGSPRAGVTA
jgi:Glycosyl transferase family 2